MSARFTEIVGILVWVWAGQYTSVAWVLYWDTLLTLGFFNSLVVCSGGFVKYRDLDSYGHRDLGAQPHDFVASDPW